MSDRIAYMPLNTYPEAAPDLAIRAALGLAVALGCGVQASAFAVSIPQVASPMAGFLIDVDGMARAAEERSKADCQRLQTLVESLGPAGPKVAIKTHRMVLGAALEAATAEARYFDLALLPWDAGTVSAQDMAQALVFGAGVPVILVPESVPAGPVDHIAIAWDESRVAARALGDALPLLAPGGRVSVLTVQGEKTLRNSGIAQALASALAQRGYRAEAVDIALNGRSIAGALQDNAKSAGAKLLAMGGFGHSRLRDFILGGATQGIFADLRMPVLLAH